MKSKVRPEIGEVFFGEWPGQGEIELTIFMVGPDPDGVECIFFKHDDHSTVGAEAIEDLELVNGRWQMR